MRSGQTDKARAAFDQFLEATLASRSVWVLGVAARCRALLSDGDEAERLYREALERLVVPVSMWNWRVPTCSMANGYDEPAVG